MDLCTGATVTATAPARDIPFVEEWSNMAYDEIDAYKRKMAEDLQKFEADLSRWRAEGIVGAPDIELDALKTQRREFGDRMRGMGLARESRWQNLMRGLGSSFERLKSDLQRWR